MDRVNGKHSLTTTLQYLRSLVRSRENDRFWALVAINGRASRDEFVQSQCEASELLHRSALVSSAWLWLKHLETQLLPLTLPKLADPRIPISERRDFADTIVRLRRCRLDPFCTRKLRRRIRTSSDLMADDRN